MVSNVFVQWFQRFLVFLSCFFFMVSKCCLNGCLYNVFCLVSEGCLMFFLFLVVSQWFSHGLLQQRFLKVLDWFLS